MRRVRRGWRRALLPQVRVPVMPGRPDGDQGRARARSPYKDQDPRIRRHPQAPVSAMASGHAWALASELACEAEQQVLMADEWHERPPPGEMARQSACIRRPTEIGHAAEPDEELEDRGKCASGQGGDSGTGRW